MIWLALAMAGSLPSPGTEQVAFTPECQVELNERKRPPPVAVSENGRWGAVPEGENLLLVDLRRCVPVAAGRGPQLRLEGGTRALRFEGDELVQDFSEGVVRWTVPRLDPTPLRGGGFRDLVDLGPRPGGLGYAQLASADDASALVDLPRVNVATTDEVVGTDERGWGYWRGLEQLAGGDEPRLGGIAGLYRAAGRLYATDGARDLDVLAGEIVPRPAGRPAVVPPGSGARFALVDVPGGMAVVGEGKRWGAVIPARAEVGLASGDGRVAFIADGEGLGAWAVASGTRLWHLPREGGEWAGAGLALGERFAALGTTGLWQLFDPADGSVAGTAGGGRLVASPAFELGGRLQWKDLAGEWDAPLPTASDWTPPPVASLVAELASYAAPSPVLPGMERAAANADGTWTWEGPTRIRAHHATEAGVVVHAEGELLMLGRDGRVRWRAPPVEEVRVSGDWVATQTTATVSLLDLDTGRRRWSVAAAELLALYGDGVVIRRVPGAPAEGLRLRDGRPGPMPRAYPVSVLGWRCTRDGCTREAAAPLASERDFRKEGDRWVEYIDGGPARALAWGTLRQVENGAYSVRGSRLHGLAEPAPPGEVAPPVPAPRGASPPRVSYRWTLSRDREWRIMDPVSGTLLASGDSRLLAPSGGPGPLHYAVARADGQSSVRDAAGVEVLRVPGEVLSLFAREDGRLLWTEGAGERRVACVQGAWCVPLGERGDQLLGWEGDAVSLWIGGVAYRVDSETGAILAGTAP